MTAMTRRPRPCDMRLALATLMMVFAAGCVTPPALDELRRTPSPHLLPGAPAGIQDHRSRFREYFCAEFDEQRAMADASASCESWLHQIPDEFERPTFASDTRVHLQALFVTGAFSECFGESARPFASAIAALAGRGDDFGTIVVGGRSGTEHNARQIADFLEAWPGDEDKPLVLFGYSKGTSDILQFLVDYPDLANRVSAVVSVAGAVGGSPLADRYGSIYDLLFSHLPSSHCEKGDREVVDSLRTDTRRSWLAENPVPSHVRYYSLAAFTTRDRMAKALVPSWKSLLQDSRRNDGQLLPVDSMLPQSSLLAYLNADHWAVTMELEKEHGIIASRPDPTPFPHTALLAAMLRLVGEDLAEIVPPGAAVSADGQPRRSTPGRPQ
jgi:dienelactone hydrolase